MALLDDADVVRVELPHEPGAWVELRRLTWGRLRAVQSLPESEHLGATFLAAVAAWSYAEPVTPESLDRIDMVTANFIAGEIQKLNGVSAGEASGSAATSSPPSSTAEPGPRS